MGAPYLTAVSISWPVIRKPPSPQHATTVLSGAASFAATAAGTP
jgi:hypothetical protein